MQVKRVIHDVGRGEVYVTVPHRWRLEDFYDAYLRELVEQNPRRTHYLSREEKAEALQALLIQQQKESATLFWPDLVLPTTVVEDELYCFEMHRRDDEVSSTSVAAVEIKKTTAELAAVDEEVSRAGVRDALIKHYGSGVVARGIDPVEAVRQARKPEVAVVVVLLIASLICMGLGIPGAILVYAATAAVLGGEAAVLRQRASTSALLLDGALGSGGRRQAVSSLRALEKQRPEPTEEGVPHVVRVVETETGNHIEMLALARPGVPEAPQRDGDGDEALLAEEEELRDGYYFKKTTMTELYTFPENCLAVSVAAWEVSSDASVSDIADAVHEIKNLAGDLERRSHDMRQEARLRFEEAQASHERVLAERRSQRELLQHVVESR